MERVSSTACKPHTWIAHQRAPWKAAGIRQAEIRTFRSHDPVFFRSNSAHDMAQRQTQSPGKDQQPDRNLTDAGKKAPSLLVCALINSPHLPNYRHLDAVRGSVCKAEKGPVKTKRCDFTRGCEANCMLTLWQNQAQSSLSLLYYSELYGISGRG